MLELAVGIGKIHTIGVRSAVRKNNADCLTPWPLVISLRGMTSRTEESLYFISYFPRSSLRVIWLQ